MKPRHAHNAAVGAALFGAVTAMAASGQVLAIIPAQVVLTPNPPPVPCLSGSCSYLPDQYASAAFYSVATGTGFGNALALGDFNKDGLEDLAVGAPLADNGVGGVWLFLGISQSLSGTIKVEGSDAFWIPGEPFAPGNAGASLAAGDLTGDGYTDLVVGAPGAGVVYVLPGTAMIVDVSGKDLTSWAGAFPISLADPNQAVLEGFGTAVAIGDVSSNSTSILQDGKNELLIGAPGGDKAYLLYGSVKNGVVAGNKSYGLIFYGAAGDMVGTTVSMLRDIDGDGMLDFAIGAPGGSVAGGKVYTIAGRSKSSYESVIGVDGLNLNSANLTRRRTFVGDLTYKSAVTGKLGSALAGLVDLNSDARPDLVMSAVTAPSVTGSSPDMGRVYLAFGSSTFFGSGTASPIVTSLSSSGLPFFVGNVSGGLFGRALASIGDVDGDGYNEFLLSSHSYQPSTTPISTGSTWMIMGRAAAKWSAGMLPDGPRFDGQYSDIEAGAVLLGGLVVDLDGDTHSDFFLSVTGRYPYTGLTEYRLYYVSSGDFLDRDGDTQSRASGDCDDQNRAVFYRSTGEVCDGYDNDCDGVNDSADASLEGGILYYPDADGDGFGDETQGVRHSCEEIIEAGWSEFSGDCNDTDVNISPGTPERCNGIDDDCDDLIDLDDSSIYTTTDSGLSWYYPDIDLDGYGYGKGGVLKCEAPPGYVTSGVDCNDSSSSIHPGAPEGTSTPAGCLSSDGVDNDCDSIIDEGTCGVDDDFDGVSEDQGDCDDTRSDISPMSEEICDHLDNNCNDQIDDGFDQDLDGFPDVRSCKGVYDSSDCNDQDPNVYPGAPARCDGVDTDCDGELPDAGFESELDADGDTYQACNNDCDDRNPLINPSAQETCDTIDNNCDDAIDNGPDEDLDGVSVCFDCDEQDPEVYQGAAELCDGKDNDCDEVIPSTGTESELDSDDDGYLVCQSDCNDQDNNEHPGAPELCDGEDNDCDDLVDESPTNGDTFYLDDDGDGEGDLNHAAEACDAPRNYVANADDCDDANAQINTQAQEQCDGLDTDCNGQSDDEEPLFDRDEDGWLDAEACAVLSDTLALDCDDLNAEIHPEAEDIPGDGIDSNCDLVDPTEPPAETLPPDLVADSLGCSCASEGASSGKGAAGGLMLALTLAAAMRRRQRRFRSVSQESRS